MYSETVRIQAGWRQCQKINKYMLRWGNRKADRRQCHKLQNRILRRRETKSQAGGRVIKYRNVC